ncbi:DUF4235 domain-containing protein [Brachybacterium sp. EF45031]|uniref:DUF4235 domain-containing protein n=1 Tax=Brachybacterium sillae TaxID=2810536 RepID=UPI00217F15C5|nr:DUF4235 domain-containing protein [Brachybacterium sillae]MCS6712266.1 DUF4235 domain-containing protein [Brachybacterium sillae]
MANPLVKLAVTGAGIAATVLSNKALKAGWAAVFDEEAPTAKTRRTSAKDTAKARKQAKKEGKSKEEIAAISDPSDDTAPWKILLWTVLTGVVVQGMKLAAQQGTKQGVQRLTSRRPRPNRG